MIRIDDLQEAIAECEGQRNPNANTCLKLASLYTILDHKQKNETEQREMPVYSFASQDQSDSTILYESDTDFGKVVNGMEVDLVMAVMDELMSTISVMMPRLYDGVMIKLQK